MKETNKTERAESERKIGIDEAGKRINQSQYIPSMVEKAQFRGKKKKKEKERNATNEVKKQNKTKKKK